MIFIFQKLSDSGVDPNLISWNRLVLLHGPPGKLATRHIFTLTDYAKPFKL